MVIAVHFVMGFPLAWMMGSFERLVLSLRRLKFILVPFEYPLIHLNHQDHFFQALIFSLVDCFQATKTTILLRFLFPCIDFAL